MVCRIAAEHEIELAIGERQALGGAVDRGDVAQATIDGSSGHHVKHLLRQVVGDHFLDQRCHLETHMTSATAQVQDPSFALPCQFGL
ncbi:hypothetical protein D3C78_1832990 [compost metagenome]